MADTTDNPLSLPDSTASPRILTAAGTLHLPLGPENQSIPLGLRPAGTQVRKGQSLLESPREGYPAPLAPADGVLGSVVPACLISGQSVTAVQLHVNAADSSTNSCLESPQVDLGNSTESENITAPDAPSLNLSGLINTLCAGGVHINRIGSPDLVGQLLGALKRPVGVVIGSCLEIDPSSQRQAATLTQSMDDVLAGLVILSKATDARRVICVFDRHWPRALRQKLRSAAAGLQVELLPMESGYPYFHPTLLLHRILKLRLRPGRLPVDVGALVIDAPGAADIAACVLRKQPMLTTQLDIHDWRSQRCIRVIVPMGMSVGQILDQVISPPQGKEMIREAFRGTLRGGAVYRNVTVEPGAICCGGEYTIQILPDLTPVQVDPCVRCGWCVDICPTRIHPAGLVEAVQRNNLPMAEDYGLDACIECGLCSWICPSHLPLLQSIRTMLNMPRDTNDY